MKNLSYKLLTACIIPLLFTACDGSSKATSNKNNANIQTGNINITGYAVDDYILGAEAKLLSEDGKKVIAQTKTGDMGKFSFSNIPSGKYQIIISQGKEDLDGLSRTTNDQKSFISQAKAWVDTQNHTSPVIVGAISTGVFEFASGSYNKYNQAINNLSDAKAYIIVENTATVQDNLKKVVNLQRNLGFDSIIAELQDDGKFNESNTISAKNLKATMTANNANSQIADLSLRQCIAVELDKAFEKVTNADLATITSLTCNDAMISSIKGIQLLNNLQVLHLQNNEISDISELAGLSKLEFANLHNNRVTTVAPLLNSSGPEIGMMIGENCMAISEIEDSARLNFSSVDTLRLKQYADCNKNDADVLVFKLIQATDNSSTLVYRTSYNANAECKIVWGDNTEQPADCTSRVTYIDKITDAKKLSKISFYVNDVVKKSIPNNEIADTVNNLVGYWKSECLTNLTHSHYSAEQHYLEILKKSDDSISIERTHNLSFKNNSCSGVPDGYGTTGNAYLSNVTDDDLVFFTKDNLPVFTSKNSFYNLLKHVSNNNPKEVYNRITQSEFEEFYKIVDETSGNDRDAVISPNGGEIWKKGQKQTISWMNQYITGDTVDLYVLHDSSSGLTGNDKYRRDIGKTINQKRWFKFASKVPNTGKFELDPKLMSGVGNDYLVLVVSTTDKRKFDISDNRFTLE